MKPIRSPFTCLSFDPKALGRDLHLPPAQVVAFFRDGRVGSLLAERVLAVSHRLRQAFSKCERFDLVSERDPRAKWEVRALSSRGCSFSPSVMRGAGRVFDQAECYRWMSALAGYLVADTTSFPKVPCWALPSELVKHWMAAGKISPKAGCSRQQFFNLVDIH